MIIDLFASHRFNQAEEFRIDCRFGEDVREKMFVSNTRDKATISIPYVSARTFSAIAPAATLAIRIDNGSRRI